jgi:hypothetical protein
MNVFELAQALVQGARAIPIDDNTFSLLVMLIGVIGGVVLTGLFSSQQKAKKVKVERKDPHKPE